MPYFNLLGSWCVNPLEGNQTDEAGSMKGRIQESVSHHGRQKGAHRLIDAGLSVVGLCEDLDESRLKLGLDLLVVGPPVVCVVQELLGTRLLESGSRLIFFFDRLFIEKFILGKGREQVRMEGQNT